MFQDAVFNSVEADLGNEDVSKYYQQITTIFDTGTVKEALQKSERDGDGLDVQRILLCKSCQRQREWAKFNEGHFNHDEGMKLQSPGGNCSNLDARHELDLRLSPPVLLGRAETQEKFEKAVMKAIVKPSDPGKNQ